MNISPVDLSGIHPERRPEVLRRLRILTEFERAPGRSNAERHALSLGISRAQFYNLFRAWKTFRDPEVLVGRSRSRKKTVTLSADLQTIVQDVLMEEPGALPNDITRKVMARAQGEGVELPQWEKLKRFVVANRKAGLPAKMAELADIVIDYTVLDLAVAFSRAKVSRPLAAVAIDTNQERIIGVHLSDGHPALIKSVRVLADGLSTMPDDPRSVAIPNVDGEQWQEFLKLLGPVGLEAKSYTAGAYAYGRYAEALLGQRFQGIRLRPRLVASSFGDRETKLVTGDKAISLSAAQELVQARFLEATSPDLDITHRANQIGALLNALARIET